MQQLGLNADIQVGGRRFHVQTAYSASSTRIISHIFDQGRILVRREVPCPDQLAVAVLSKKLQAVHQDMIAEMELLFHIADKVRQVRHALSCLKMGMLFLDRNLLEDAREFLLLAVELDPASVEAHGQLGHVYLRRGDPAQAVTTLQRGLELAPQYADLHFHLGVAFLDLRQWPAAQQAFEAALGINPDFHQARLHLALAMVHSLAAAGSDRHAAAIVTRIQEVLAQLAQNQGVAPSVAQLTAVRQLLIERKFVPAATELEQLRQSPAHDSGLAFENEFYLKFMYGGKGRDDEFVQHHAERLRAALQDFPEYADLHNNLGIAYLIQSRNLFLRALDEFRTALRINPNFKRAAKNLKISENDGKGFLILLRALLK